MGLQVHSVRLCGIRLLEVDIVLERSDLFDLLIEGGNSSFIGIIEYILLNDLLFYIITCNAFTNHTTPPFDQFLPIKISIHYSQKIHTHGNPSIHPNYSQNPNTAQKRRMNNLLYQGGVLYLTLLPDPCDSPPSDLGTGLAWSRYSYGSLSLGFLRFPVPVAGAKLDWGCGG